MKPTIIICSPAFVLLAFLFGVFIVAHKGARMQKMANSLVVQSCLWSILLASSWRTHDDSTKQICLCQNFKKKESSNLLVNTTAKSTKDVCLTDCWSSMANHSEGQRLVYRVKIRDIDAHMGGKQAYYEHWLPVNACIFSQIPEIVSDSHLLSMRL